MGNALLTVILLRMRVLNLKWGITLTGMSLACGRGFFLSIAVLGAGAFLTGHAQVPALGVVCMGVAYGMVAGLLWGLVPRRPRFGVFRRPTLRRVAFCTITGGVWMPLFCSFAQVPTSPDGPNSWYGETVLVTGVLSVIPYLVAQRQRGIRHQQGLPPRMEPLIDLRKLRVFPPADQGPALRERHPSA